MYFTTTYSCCQLLECMLIVLVDCHCACVVISFFDYTWLIVWFIIYYGLLSLFLISLINKVDHV